MTKTYKRARVQFNLQIPFVILDPRSPFDSILGWLAAEKILAAGGTDKEAEAAVMDLPIRKVSYKNSFFYAASVADTCDGFSQEYFFSKGTTFLRYDQVIGDTEDMKTILAASLLDRTRSTYKPAIIKLKSLNTRSVNYVVDITDEVRFCDLLSGLTHLGKKSAHGFGKLRAGDQAFELFYDAEDIVIKRAIPFDTDFLKAMSRQEGAWIGMKAKIEGPYYVTRLLPPYWKQDDGGVLCGTGIF